MISALFAMSIFSNSQIAVPVPTPGKTILVLGQDLDAIAEYDRLCPLRPAGYAVYTSLRGLEGLTEEADMGGGRQFAAKVARDHPGAALQVGLNVVGDLEEILSGRRDGAIHRLVGFLNHLHRPILLRFGYEFDYPDNGYEPQAYQRAYRHFVHVMRAAKAQNVAYVWHSYAAPRKHALDSWYPGDEFVDWCALSYFHPGLVEQEDIAAFAKLHGKPLMIAESAPWGLTPGNSWKEWFEPLFRFVEMNDVAALCYINCDWNQIPMFKSQHWGDSRLGASQALLEHWISAIKSPRFGCTNRSRPLAHGKPRTVSSHL